jgi:catechol 2,3-dioxygenase
MRTRVIENVGHIALRVRDLDAAVEHATTIMGLRVVEAEGDRVDLTHGHPHHSLQYIAADTDSVDHVGLEAAGPEALDLIRERLAERGVELLSEEPLDGSLGDGFAFEAPHGFVFEIYTGMPKDQPDYLPHGVRPRRFGHVNFALPETTPMIELLTEVLDFRISDFFRGGAFTRCNAEHHGIGVLHGPGVIHHHAWEVENVGDLGRLGDVLDELGSNIIAGPVRHSMGNNIAAYITGPGGICIEYYCDMFRIFDESNYSPGDWSEEEGSKWYSRWSPQLPEPSVRELGMPPAPPRRPSPVGS